MVLGAAVLLTEGDGIGSPFSIETEDYSGLQPVNPRRNKFEFPSVASTDPRRSSSFGTPKRHS